MDSDSDDNTAGMSVISKAERVLRALSATTTATAVNLAADLDEPITSIYRILNHLERIGWIERGSARGQFRLGIDLIQIGQDVESTFDLRQVATRTLVELSELTQESSYLCVQNDRRAVCIDRVDGEFIQAAEMPLGGSLPLHRGAASRAILAFTPFTSQEDYIKSLFAADANPFTESDAALLRSELAAIRESGVSVSDGDVTPGTRTAAAPILNHRNEVLGSIAVSGLTARTESHAVDIPALVTSAAMRISVTFGYQAREVVHAR